MEILNITRHQNCIICSRVAAALVKKVLYLQRLFFIEIYNFKGHQNRRIGSKLPKNWLKKGFSSCKPSWCAKLGTMGFNVDPHGRHLLASTAAQLRAHGIRQQSLNPLLPCRPADQPRRRSGLSPKRRQ